MLICKIKTRLIGIDVDCLCSMVILAVYNRTEFKFSLNWDEFLLWLWICRWSACQIGFSRVFVLQIGNVGGILAIRIRLDFEFLISTIFEVCDMSVISFELSKVPRQRYPIRNPKIIRLTVLLDLAIRLGKGRLLPQNFPKFLRILLLSFKLNHIKQIV